MKRIYSKKLLVTAIAAASFGLANVASAQQQDTQSQEEQPQDRTNETAGTVDQATFETEAVVIPTGSEPGAIERETTQETEQSLETAATDIESDLDAPAEQTERTAEEIEREAERNLTTNANEYGEAAEELNNETERLLQRQQDSQANSQEAMNTASENAESTYQSLTREYEDFLGDDAEPLISSLRNGEDLQYEKEGETMTIENKVGETQDSRDIHYALALAKAELGDDAELNEIANFIQGDEGVLMKHADGQDWSQIYTEYGYEMDQLISANLRNSQASTETSSTETSNTETSSSETSADSQASVRETPDSVPADVDEDRQISQADDAGIPDNWENDADAVEETAEEDAEADSPREIADRGEVPRNQ